MQAMRTRKNLKTDPTAAAFAASRGVTKRQKRNRGEDMRRIQLRPRAPLAIRFLWKRFGRSGTHG